MSEVQLSTLGSVIKTAYESQPDTNNFSDADKTALEESVPYVGASGDVDLGDNGIAAAEFYVPIQGNIIDPELLVAFPTNQLPKIWILSNDVDGSGLNSPTNSITLTNSSTVNKFGEIAFNKWTGKTGSATDMWSLQSDPHRLNVETLELRRAGATTLEFEADNSSMITHTNVVLDGSIGKILQSYNAARTTKVNMVRMATINATADYMILGMSSSDLKGVSIQSGVGGEAIRIPGATAEAWFINRVGIGTGSAGGTAKLTVYGANGENTAGQTIRLGISSSLDYSMRRNNGNGDFEMQGTQSGAMGYKWMNTTAAVMYLSEAGALAVGSSAPAASAALDVQSTTKGVLFPRMTTTQKNAISSPAEGLVVYDTTLHKLCLRTASAWETITSA